MRSALPDGQTSSTTEIPDGTRDSSLTSEFSVALLTAGRDRPYVFGVTMALASESVSLDVIGSDEVDFREFHTTAKINFLNLRSAEKPGASFAAKALSVVQYYARLIRYAVSAKPAIFHILWNGRLETFDRTLLMVFYKLLRKKIVLTVHNVNAGKRDYHDTRLNRFTLRVQYQLADHLFVHTERMKGELTNDFDVNAGKITVIPFGIHNAAPRTELSSSDAKRRLGVGEHEKLIMFFGRITAYKGVEYLLDAFRDLVAQHGDYRLIIAGPPDRDEEYCRAIGEKLKREIPAGRYLLRAEHVPDDEVEIYFKAADVFALPYRGIYESGVLYLGQSFGLPALGADVGSFKEEIVEGKTGFVFRSEDASALANTIERYFASDLYANLSKRRMEIRKYVSERHSWAVVGKMTRDVYSGLMRAQREAHPSSCKPEGADTVPARAERES